MNALRNYARFLIALDLGVAAVAVIASVAFIQPASITTIVTLPALCVAVVNLVMTAITVSRIR